MTTAIPIRGNVESRCATRYEQFLSASAPLGDLGRSAAAEDLAGRIAAAPARRKRTWRALLRSVAAMDRAWRAGGGAGVSPLGALAELLVRWRPRA